LRVSVISKLDSHELTAETATSSSNYAWDITGLRVAFAVLPEDCARDLAVVRSKLDMSTSIITQIAAAEFIARGDYEAHIRRMRSVYRAKRDHLLDLLRKHCSSLDALSSPGGFHMTCRVPGPRGSVGSASDRAAATAERIRGFALEQGVEVTSIANYSRLGSGSDLLFLRYGGLTEPEITSGVLTLERAIRQAGLRTGRR
jgi:GntR family transcriptional regulator/MocR family aminotransferase